MPKTQDTATPLEKDTLSKTRTRCQRRTNEREERRTIDEYTSEKKKRREL